MRSHKPDRFRPLPEISSHIPTDQTNIGLVFIQLDHTLNTLLGEFKVFSGYKANILWWQKASIHYKRVRHNHVLLYFINCDRSVEILYAAAVAKTNKMSEQLNSLLKLLPDLNVGRQELALFQHHDAITGTSRKTVTENYKERYRTLIKKIHFGKDLVLIMIK